MKCPKCKSTDVSVHKGNRNRVWCRACGIHFNRDWDAELTEELATFMAGLNGMLDAATKLLVPSKAQRAAGTIGTVPEEFQDQGWDNAPRCAYCDEHIPTGMTALCNIGAGLCGYHHDCVGDAAYDIRFYRGG